PSSGQRERKRQRWLGRVGLCRGAAAYQPSKLAAFGWRCLQCRVRIRRSDAAACAHRSSDMSAFAIVPMRRLTKIYAVALFAALAMFASPALAGCTVAPGDIGLGSETSFATSKTPREAGGSTGFACTGSGVL